MVMSWIFTGILGLSVLSALLLGNGPALGASVLDGAQNGMTLALSLAGGLCLWSGVGRLMERLGLTAALARLLRPVLHRLFPSTKQDPVLAGALSANICANILGLGNAATPLGIQAVRRMADPRRPHRATEEMCRLIVLNTASIQLIPTTVGALRVAQGCATPFDILPAVWITSICSAGLGLCAAWVFGKLWPHD